MASFVSHFGARRDLKQSARDAIVTLRQQLQVIKKKEEYLQKRIDDEVKKAKANAVSNKAVATVALKRKKASEAELDNLAEARLQLEMQVNILESGNLNAETMATMKKASDALMVVHGNLTMDKVDAAIVSVNEQRELANEVAEAISNPMYGNMDIDEDELKAELAELEQDELNERMSEAERASVHMPAGAERHRSSVAAAPGDDEEAQLRELQAALAM